MSRTLLEIDPRNLSREITNFRRLVVYDDLHVIVGYRAPGHGLARNGMAGVVGQLGVEPNVNRLDQARFLCRVVDLCPIAQLPVPC